MQNSFLLYGANGYTGELIARHAAQYGLHPILAGRREEALRPLAARLNYPYKIFDVADSNTLLATLKEVRVVVNAAGPFQFTAKPIIDASLQTGTHYLDVNGDIAVFEIISQMDSVARRAGIMLLPGSGFDVVPTDCTALLLKKLLPDAITLKLAFANIGGGLSHGTATTMVNKLGQGGAVRKDGKIVSVPLGENLTALDRRLDRIWLSRSTSHVPRRWSGASTTKWCSPANFACSSTTLETISAKSAGAGLITNRPAPILVESRRSSTSRRIVATLFSILTISRLSEI